MKTTDLAKFLTEFLKTYLPGKRELSTNTIMSYRDTFRFLLVFAEDMMNIPAEKLTIADLTEDLVLGYLKWLEVVRLNCVATKRQRLAAIHVFIHFLKTRKPEYLLEYQKILDIRVKRAPQHNIEYLSPAQVKAVLAAPDLHDRFGRRDMVLLALLYDSAARVQEICDLSVCDIRLAKPSTVTIMGKGQKKRIVPIMSETSDVVRKHLETNALTASQAGTAPLFFNHQGCKLTRAGVTYILKKHCDTVRQKDPLFPENVSPHQLRHSKAMHMLKAGTDLIYIRDFLGHSHLLTTEIYAKADTEMKRIAIERASPQITPDLPDWTEDASLMATLKDLCR